MSNLPHVRPKYSGEEVAMELDDTQTLRALTAEGHLPPLLILSRETALIETVRKAAPTGMAIRHAATLDEIVDRLTDLEPGILLVDAGNTADLAAMLSQLTQHFPEMVAVVAGRREDSGALLRLTAEGRVFRFLLTPLSHGQTRLALKAAAAQHIDLKASSARRGIAAEPARRERNYLAPYGLLGAALLVVIAVVWFGVSRLIVEPQPTVASTESSARTPSSLPQRLDPVSAELALAKEAFDAGRYLEPRGESALDFYRSTLALDPNNEPAKLGVRHVADKILESAEAALTAERLEEAVRNLETARDIDPTHSRLAFLDVQVARERERLKLTQVRGVEQRVRALVAQANEDLRAGRLISPVRDNARGSLLEARKLDPTDPIVAQGIRDLSAALTEEARKSLASGKLREAQMLVDAARQLGAAGAALSAVERQLVDATRTSAAPTQAVAEASARPAIVVEPPIAEPRQHITEAKPVESVGASSSELIKTARDAIDDGAYDRAAKLLNDARAAGGAADRDSIANVELELAAARQRTSETPAQAASLRRTREVAAQYPREALLSGVEGWVHLEFTISADGIPGDISVRGSQPGRTFDRAAIDALRKWRFEPIVHAGVPVSQRAEFRFIFKTQ
jgi:protein TonB